MAKGKSNSSLKSWVAFVKKVQKEENISYPEAMKRASARKSEWKRGGAESSTSTPMPTSSPMSTSFSPYNNTSSSSSSMTGGKKKRRTKKNKKSRKHRKSRRRRN